MDHIVVVLRSGIEFIERDGDGWKRSRHQPAPSLECIAVHPYEPERLFVGSFEAGIQRRTAGDDRFESVSDDTMPAAITSLAIDPGDPDTILAGTEPSRLYRSDDGGETWTQIEGLTAVSSASEWSFPPRPDTHHVRWIEIDPTDPDRWYVGIEAGALVVTPDGGETWIDRPLGSLYDNHTLATHSADRGRVYSAAGDGYAESVDGGESWKDHEAGLDHRYVWGLAVDPIDSEIRMVSAARSASHAHRISTASSYLYRKIGDSPWDRLTETGHPTGEGVLRAALAAGTNAGEFVSASNRGIFHTTSAGDHWERITDQWQDEYGESTVRAVTTI